MRLKFSSEIGTNYIFKRDWHFQASHPPSPNFCGEISRSRLRIASEIEVFKRDWSFQARLKLPSVSLKNSSVQARMVFFKIRALWDSNRCDFSCNFNPLFHRFGRDFGCDLAGALRFAIWASKCRWCSKNSGSERHNLAWNGPIVRLGRKGQPPGKRLSRALRKASAWRRQPGAHATVAWRLGNHLDVFAISCPLQALERCRDICDCKRIVWVCLSSDRVKARSVEGGRENNVYVWVSWGCTTIRVEWEGPHMFVLTLLAVFFGILLSLNVCVCALRLPLVIAWS